MPREGARGLRPRDPVFPGGGGRKFPFVMAGEAVLYELVGKNSKVSFSPYVWRVRMALKHKAIPFRVHPLTFVQIKPTVGKLIENADEAKVPVLTLPNGQSVADSWKIAEFLEDNYTDKPSLFGGETSRYLNAAFVNYVNQLHGQLAKVLLPRVYESLDEESKPYFKTTREQRLGSFDNLIQIRDQLLKEVEPSLAHFRITLSQQPFLSGPNVGFADYTLFGMFQWARAIAPIEYEKIIHTRENDPLEAWVNRLLDLYDGYARNSETVPKS